MSSDGSILSESRKPDTEIKKKRAAESKAATTMCCLREATRSKGGCFDPIRILKPIPTRINSISRVEHQGKLNFVGFSELGWLTNNPMAIRKVPVVIERKKWAKDASYSASYSASPSLHEMFRKYEINI